MKQSTILSHWKLLSISALILAFAVAGCDQSPLTPVNPTGNDHPTISGQALGVVTVTFTGVGTPQMRADINIAANSAPTPPANSNGKGDGTIQLKFLSNGTFTTGVRGDGGMRYFYATYKVRNATLSGDAYDTKRTNLTFIAINNNKTYGSTAVADLRLFDGTELQEPKAIQVAKTIIPTGRVIYTGGKVQPAEADVLQVLTQDEADQLSSQTGADVFQFGFVTHSPHTTPGSRTLPKNPDPNVYDGLITFAFKMKLSDKGPKHDPFVIKMVFLAMDVQTTSLTQSLQEQTPKGAANIKQRLKQLDNVSYMTLLPGSNFQGAVPFHRLCGPVRVAGKGTNAIPLFPTPPELQSLSPDPKAGSASSIPLTTTFSATFDKAVQKANARNFIVRGSQSGLHFINSDDYTTSGNTVSTPTPTTSTTFFPGERVRVTLTTGLGSCRPTVASYRVEVTSGSGTFKVPGTNGTVSVGSSPGSVISGNWNSDGDLDLAVTNYFNNSVSILKNNGSGSFTPTSSQISVGEHPVGITAGDWDGDGDLDLAVTNTPFNGGSVSILKNDGNGSFTVIENVSVGKQPQSISVGDWDGDSDLDLAVINSTSGTVSILKNDGSGSFTVTGTVSVGGEPVSITVGDWNGDGDLDLAIANEDGKVNLLTNKGTGRFTHSSVSVVAGLQTIAVGDWDKDGDLDLATVKYGNGNIYLLINNGSGDFNVSSHTVQAGSDLESIATGDWNGDGDLDLVVAGNASNGKVYLLTNNGNGRFSPSGTGVSVGTEPNSITVGDWNGDGDLDLAVTNQADANVSILINQ